MLKTNKASANKVSSDIIKDYAARLGALYRTRFEITDLLELTGFISKTAINDEHKDRITKLKEELSRTDELIINEIMRIYNNEDINTIEEE